MMQINKLYNDNEIITLDSYLMKCGVIDTEEYLHPYYNELDDPFQYLNMALGIEMFQKHFDALSDTYIICDSDLDGIVSTVIMYQYMKALCNQTKEQIL
jgi:single-stranded-DNA-specific exonuclease